MTIRAGTAWPTGEFVPTCFANSKNQFEIIC